MANGSLAPLYWRVFDAVDYWLTHARLWLADAVCGPEPETGVAGDVARQGPSGGRVG